VATGVVALALVLAGVALVWLAWRRSQYPDASRGAGVVALAVSGAVLVAGSALAAHQVRRGRLSDGRDATSA
jgi:drug/metabolite transporter (DMT)-like permease